ncbi:MAG: class I SAM-dependent methyltransferase [Lachnospiraceae bacterium]|nr:class I SAM-dependent methyltransferase [Lachnospiraceae bacterium]
MNKASSIKCDICGAESILIHEGTRDNPDINVYECTSCHTKQLDRIVDNDYDQGFMNEKLGMTAEEIADRLSECRIDDYRRYHMVKDWCRGKRVLDFGCGFGGFLQNISQDAGDVAGVELGCDERGYLTNLGYDVRSSILDHEIPFDVITMFHVFEHLKSPQKWLNDIAGFLKPGGILFIEVPNANDVLLSLYENSAFADFTYWSAHLYLYTKESLTRVIKENGYFEIESDGQFQRYPIANHFYWLAKGKPGGQNVWTFLNSEEINKEYSKMLEEQNMCDTLFFRMIKKGDIQ